jgi:hypothetical protein
MNAENIKIAQRIACIKGDNMAPTFESVIEAMARKIAALEKPEIAWENHPPSFRNYCIGDARVALCAQRDMGLLLVAKVPGEVRHLFGPAGERQRAEGWNACRAEVLAHVVEMPADE